MNYLTNIKLVFAGASFPAAVNRQSAQCPNSLSSLIYYTCVVQTTLICTIMHTTAGCTAPRRSLAAHMAHLFMGESHHIVSPHNKSDVTGYESSYEAINIKTQTNAVCALFIMTSLHPYLQHTSGQTRRDISSVLPKRCFAFS